MADNNKQPSSTAEALQKLFTDAAKSTAEMLNGKKKDYDKEKQQATTIGVRG